MNITSCEDFLSHDLLSYPISSQQELSDIVLTILYPTKYCSGENTLYKAATNTINNIGKHTRNSSNNLSNSSAQTFSKNFSFWNYFYVRDEKQWDCSYKATLQNRMICGKDTEMIIIVQSAVENFKKREQTRGTWLSLLHKPKNTSLSGNFTIKAEVRTTCSSIGITSKVHNTVIIVISIF